MALILFDNKYVFEETIVLKDKATKESKFEFKCQIDDIEAQRIKELFRLKEDLTVEQEQEVYHILFKDDYETIKEEIGEFKLEEFGLMLVTSLLGKLGNERIKNMSYVSTKYQNHMKK